MTREEAAVYLRYERASSAMDDWLKQMGVKTVPGRKGIYDRRAIDRALDQAAGISEAEAVADAYDDWKLKRAG